MHYVSPPRLLPLATPLTWRALLRSVGPRGCRWVVFRRPWIAPLERSRCAAALSLPFTAMMEGIGDDPALVDTLGDPDALTSALLPAAGSRCNLFCAFVVFLFLHVPLTSRSRGHKDNIPFPHRH